MSTTKQPVFIDVREPDEFKMEHVPDAINIPLSRITHTEQLTNIAQDTPLIVYCRSGARASVAIGILEKQGYTNAINGINTEQATRLLTR